MAPVTAPRLEALPEELVSNIVVKLDSDSSFAFRLTCRALEQKSLHEWATEYFGQKAIIPSSTTLKMLASIADCEKLRGYLHHIYIIPALFSSRVFNCCHGPSCKWKHTVRQEEAMHSFVDDQKDLKRDCKLQERLTHIFKQLPELHGISFSDSFGSVPAEVDILGHASFARKTNNTLTTLPLYPEDKDFYAWKTYVWKSTLQAIAFSEISTIKTLLCSLDNVKNPLTLADLNFNSRTLHHLGKALRNVEWLRLQITSNSETTGDESRFNKTTAAKRMKNLASLMSSIGNLDLTMSYSEGTAIMCQSFFDNIAVSKIHKLKLDGIFLNSKFLGTLICGLINVESMFLEWINLTKGAWPNILEAILKLEKLKHLHLTFLSVPSGSACFLKPLDRDEAARSRAPDGWTAFPTAGEEGAHTGPFAGDILGSSSSEFMTDEEDYDDDSGDEEDDDDEDDAGSEAESSNAPQPAPTAPPTLSQVLSGLYPDSDAETDDSMPDLESQTREAPLQAALAPVPAASSTDNAQSQNHRKNRSPPDPDSLEARLGQGIERGRNICLKTSKEIQTQLPKFMKEYHIVDEEGEDGMLGFGGLAMGMGPGGIGLAAGGGNAGGIGAGTANGTGAGAVPVPPAGVNALFNALMNGPPAPGAVGYNTHGNGFTIAGPFFGPPAPPAAAPHTGAGAGAADEYEDDWMDEE